MNYIDYFFNLVNGGKNNKQIKTENNKIINFYYAKKECRDENSEIITWNFYIDKNDEEDEIKTIIYEKNTQKYKSQSEENDYINFSFMDDEWLESKKIKFDGKIILEPNLYILETIQPQYVLMFALGISWSSLLIINEIIEEKKEKMELTKNNIVDRFFASCEKIGKNIFKCQTECKEIGEVEHVIFEYDPEKDKNIDDDIICWKGIVSYTEIDKKTNLKKEKRSKRELYFDLITKEYTIDTTAHMRFSNISYMYPEWIKKKNIKFDDTEIYIHRNCQRLEDRIFRLRTKDAKYAIMTFLGVNYDFLCKL
jgi:hypothetical protein